MQTYDTVTEALRSLQQQGYTTDFNLEFDAIKCSATHRKLAPHEFEIVAHYRFEGDTDPGDEEVVYVIEAKDGSMKGTLVSAYGAYSEAVSEEMIRKLKMHHD
ncbi:MAG TPA: phosphoribosylpyrophosphate synthetase [Chitinophagaceae bacterium]|nr:phosphoribosylpyrophosphate synthetase [Chitinophagaceae bacterium]